MIRSIVFDMGNVLISFQPGLFIDRLGIGGEDKALLLKNVFQSIEWAALDHGSMTEDEAIESMCRRLPERLHAAARKLVCEWDLPLIELEEMYELASGLKKNGYKLYLLTNASARQPEYWARAKASGLMDGTLVSAKEKLIKPQPEIYRLLCSRFGLKEEECFFIDDNICNAESAVFCGMKAAVFHGDAAALKAELTAAGVNI